jgi:PIN domain nuclease of toxin-antitoxin system
MRLLLDTHVLLWFYQGSSHLSPVARAAIEDSSNQCFVSHASAWEVAVKLSLGKLHLQVAYEDLFPRAVLANGFEILLPDFRHYRELLQLPFYHRDPFDRLLIAQAKIEDMVLVTNDAHIANYDLRLLW